MFARPPWPPRIIERADVRTLRGHVLNNLIRRSLNALDYRNQMLAAITGRTIHRIPWVPRMDLWCIANRARGTIPDELAGVNEVGIATYLAVACHALGADRTLTREPGDFALVGLGFDSHPDYPFRLELRDLSMRYKGSFEEMTTVIETSKGDVTIRSKWTDEMRRSGISGPMVTEHAVKRPADLDAVAEVFEHLEVISTPGGYAAFRERVGERGLAVAQGPVAASPAHLLLHDLMSMEDFFYLWADDRKAIGSFARRLEPFFDALLEAEIRCAAEVVYWGANYDQNITWPAFFEGEMIPWLRRASERLHQAGKFLLSHTDGENRTLLPFYGSAGFDVAQSVCPYPMTSLTLRQVREGLAAHQTLWGGIPSVALLPDSMSDDAFEAFLDGLSEQVGAGDRLILSVSDNVPPDADLGRLRRIGDRIDTLRPAVRG